MSRRSPAVNVHPSYHRDEANLSASAFQAGVGWVVGRLHLYPLTRQAVYQKLLRRKCSHSRNSTFMTHHEVTSFDFRLSVWCSLVHRTIAGRTIAATNAESCHPFRVDGAIMSACNATRKVQGPALENEHVRIGSRRRLYERINAMQCNE